MAFIAYIFDRLTVYTLAALYVYNLLYALMYWGFWGAVLNVILPTALLWDLVGRLGRI